LPAVTTATAALGEGLAAVATTGVATNSATARNGAAGRADASVVVPNRHESARVTRATNVGNRSGRKNQS
jgi:hypothetical protein